MALLLTSGSRDTDGFLQEGFCSVCDAAASRSCIPLIRPESDPGRARPGCRPAVNDGSCDFPFHWLGVGNRQKKRNGDRFL